MTIGPPIDLGSGPVVGPPVNGPGAGQVTGGGVTGPPPAAAALDDLVDVEAPPDQPGLLERQGDGHVRPIPRDDVISNWFSGHGGPGLVLGAARGDMYLDLDTGQLYQLG